ncbi:MAG: ABC transporter permease [Paludisphaera borealis]|uniref:ABC transporter permease n=1 Tax=Paludisphaera borealis TaxID=1387353 RepID=UPI00283F2B3E|nr:ABC transporter permease [Paludisphaera borealis]MDR3618988.1 ABC transporter permease [Paludisphaera borealis]
MAIGTSMNASESESPAWLAPIGWLGWLVVGTLGHLGATAVVMISAATSFVRSSDDDEEAGLWSATIAELSWMLFAGCPLVGLVHVAMGSFLSLQAYYGSTFVDGTWAVVGVGLLRNLASMMTGLTLAGLLPVRIIPELRDMQRRRRIERARATQAEAVRGSTGRPTAAEREAPIPSPGRLAGPRLLAAVVATPLLSIWGCLVGTVVGWQSSGTLMGLPSETFFLMFVRMIWYRDVVGLLVKGSLFGLFTAALSCSEGLRNDESETDGDEVRGGSTHGAAILRASCLSMAAILLINMTWFVLIYHAAPVYGPSLLQPPTP